MNAAGWSPTTLSVSRALLARQRHFLRAGWWCHEGARFSSSFFSSCLGSARGVCSQSTEPMRAGETRRARRAGEEDERNSSLPCVVHFVVTDMTDTWETCLSHALAQKQNVLHSHEEQGRKHEAGGGAHHDALSLPPKHGVGAGSSAGR